MTVTLDVPAFRGFGISQNGDVLVRIADVVEHLSRVADAFDKAGANADISLSLRTVRDGLVDPAVWAVRAG